MFKKYYTVNMKVLFGFFVLTALSLVLWFFIIPKYRDATPLSNFITEKVTPTHTPFSLQDAPSESLKGKLTITSDGVLRQDRVATESAKISDDITIGQGEKVETDEEGNALIEFTDTLDLTVFPNSSVDIIQTLPTNLVFSLNRGRTNFAKKGSNTISVRIKHLLTQVEGNVDISLADDKPIISLRVISGSITLAYNNLNYETQSLKVSEGKTIEFNDSTRKVVAR